MLDEAMRYRLHLRLEEVLGAEEANALMGEMSPHEWSELATKTDLALLATKSEVALLATKSEVALLATKSELSTELSLLATKSEVSTEFALLRADIAVLGYDLRAELHKTITDQTHKVFFPLIGVLVAFGGLIIAAANIN